MTIQKPIWGLRGPVEERSQREKATRAEIRATYKRPSPLPSGVWDCAPNPPAETRLEWLQGAFPDEPKKELEKLSHKHWFEVKEKDREKLKKAVDFHLKSS